MFTVINADCLSLDTVYKNHRHKPNIKHKIHVIFAKQRNVQQERQSESSTHYRGEKTVNICTITNSMTKSECKCCE